MKRTLNPGTMVYPLPAVLVTCGTMEESNVLTIAWTGIINSNPPMTYVSIRPERYSHHIVKENMEFVINLTTQELVYATDYAGCTTGRKEDKFAKLKLTKEAADKVKAPLIAECPVNLECKVTEIKELGSHDMFMAEIVAVHVNEELFDKKDAVRLEWANLMTYTHSAYLPVGKRILGTYGYSVMKPKTLKKKKAESRHKSYITGKSKRVSKDK